MSNSFLPPPSSPRPSNSSDEPFSVLKAKSVPACPRGLKYNAARIRALEPMTEVRKRDDDLVFSLQQVEQRHGYRLFREEAATQALLRKLQSPKRR
ncbi:uncharacterized protein RAG0_12803 [Rhynchosporium agropyri]|uniref:Uncharacterized protein n=1 Tax=Rhynchosporium agropyri TaxID=914238 RepID=A0A1E1L9N5_9HELO|nr:uncharacterized protein RAG0_12803 [Rhynchosporium agropyri]